MIGKLSRVLLLGACVAAFTACTAIAQSGKFPVIVVAADGTGDFGPSTPGTTTAGWQEAINECVSRHADLFIKGGATYNIGDTVRFPATQNWVIDGGEYIANWIGPANKDMILLDTAEDGHYQFGTFVYAGTAAAVHVRPVNLSALDQVSVFTDSELRIASVVYSLNRQPGIRQGGTGVVLDATIAHVAHTDFYFGCIRDFAVGINAFGGAGGVGLNRIFCPDLRTCASNSTLAMLGNSSGTSDFNATIAVDSGATGVKGLDVSGSYYSFNLASKGGFAPGNELIFEWNAFRNRANLIPLPGGDPLAMVTDSSGAASNKVTWTGTAPGVRTLLSGSSGGGWTWNLWNDWPSTPVVPPVGIGPEGAWSYGKNATFDANNPLNLTYTPMPVYDPNWWGWNVGAYADGIGVTPYIGNMVGNARKSHSPTVIRWTAPRNMTVDVTGFANEDPSQNRPQHVYVLKGSSVLFEGLANDTTPKVSFNLSNVSIGPGESLYFYNAPYPNPGYGFFFDLDCTVTETAGSGSGNLSYTHKLYPASVAITGGTVTSVQVVRGPSTIDFGASRSGILLSPGDRLQVTYSSTPTIQLIPQVEIGGGW